MNQTTLATIEAQIAALKEQARAQRRADRQAEVAAARAARLQQHDAELVARRLARQAAAEFKAARVQELIEYIETAGFTVAEIGAAIRQERAALKATETADKQLAD